MPRLDAGQRAREFTRRTHPRHLRRKNNEARLDALSNQLLTAYALATQPEQNTYVETLPALPEATAFDVGRFIVVQPPGSSQTITYIGTLSSGDQVFWLEVSGTTDFVAYSHVFNFTTTNGLMADVRDDGLVLATRIDSDIFGFYDPETGSFLGNFGSFTANNCNAVAGGNQIQTPAGVKILDFNSVFVSYRDCHKIVVWDDASNAIRSADFVIGSGVAGSGTNDFNQPWGLDHDGQSLFVADSGNDRIIKRGLEPPYAWEATIGSAGAGTGQFEAPHDVAIDQSGNIYVADTGNHRVQKFTPAGVFVLAIGGPSAGTGEGEFSLPESLAFDPPRPLARRRHGQSPRADFRPEREFPDRLRQRPRLGGRATRYPHRHCRPGQRARHRHRPRQ